MFVVPRPNGSSRWGTIQHVQQRGEGIWFVSTASHGGYVLDPERFKELQAKCKFTTFAGGANFEEDEDWSVVVIAFPKRFDDRSVYNAIRTVRNADTAGRFKTVLRLLECSQQLLAIEARQKALTEGLWEVGGLGGGGFDEPWQDHWSVTVSRGGKHRSLMFAKYPEKQFYSDDELSGLTEFNPNMYRRHVRKSAQEATVGSSVCDFEPGDADPGL